MERIACISGGTFIYWSSVILTLAVVAAVAIFAALYLYKNGNLLAVAIAVPVAAVISAVLARLIHWYCRADSYPSMQSALADYSWGGYALMGVFAGCILTACLLRLLQISKNLPEMLDCMAVAGGFGIAVGRLASFFNSSDRGLIMPDGIGLPFAYPVTNAVSGVVENRLATFMLQAIVTGTIVLGLLIYMVVCGCRKKKPKDGDIFCMFLAAYGGSQIVFDSTRYDSLFMRSNGFISIVQILGAVALVLAVIVFSVRMVKNGGLRFYHFLLWVGFVGLLGVAGYMEYYVQRHGNQALFAYSVMGSCIAAAVILTLVIRYLAIRTGRTPASAEDLAHME